VSRRNARGPTRGERDSPNTTARELPRERAIPVPQREENAPLLQTPKGRGILAVCAGVAIVAVALVVMLNQRQTKPRSVPANPEPPATVVYTPAPAIPAQVMPVTAPSSLPGSVSGATKESAPNVGDLAGVLKSYRDSLEIHEKLAKQDPANAGGQRDSLRQP
jgi:hypothetical protein